MCRWGDTVPVSVMIDESLSHSGRAYRRYMGIDRCIAPIVKALDQAGVYMLSSCCGHGDGDGEIILADGRTLILKH